MGQPPLTIIQTEDFKTLLKTSLKLCLKELQEEEQEKNGNEDLGENLHDTLNIKDAALLIGNKVSYIYQLKAENAIPYIQKKPRDAIKFSRKELKAWLNSGRPNIFKKVVEEFTIQDIKRRGK